MASVKERLESGDWKEFRVLVPTPVYKKLGAEAVKNRRTPGNHTAWLLDGMFSNKKRRNLG